MNENNIKLEGAERDAYIAKRFPSTLNRLIDVLGKPSAFDSWDNYMGEKPDTSLYLVLARNRDSSIATNCNWDSAKSMFDDAELDYTITHVGHWLCGWVEYLSVSRNDSEAFKMGEEIDASLSDYPILDEEELCRREHEDFIEVIEMVYDDDYNVGEDYEDWEELAYYLNEHGYYHHEGSSPSDEQVLEAMWEVYLKDRLEVIARGLSVGETITEGSWEISKITSLEGVAHHDCEDEPRMLSLYRDHPNQILMDTLLQQLTNN